MRYCKLASLAVMTAVTVGFHTLPALAKNTRIRCEMTDLAQGKRIVAPLNQHPWSLDVYLNEARTIVRVQGPLTRTISKNPIIAVVTSLEGGNVKFRWSLPSLRHAERRMSGFYQFQASLNLTKSKVFLWVSTESPNGNNPAFVTGKCRKI
ncbi:hypothetical protein [Pseudophaeobacter sp.]|uniref:hypothetical protein n=1 Tax=Pseudophaeobacter sp. TaxID=1971739 RepID=UPI00260F0452|nr:hypothetical protein [Pseudophaeobacter sp.]